jgi:hypothetical protein
MSLNLRSADLFFFIKIPKKPKENPEMTFNDGCLGSRNDEERSEMRYVMRIADSVNHQIFERTLRFRVAGSNLV